MPMSGKQFKVLNRKLNSILQYQADSGSKHSVSRIEVDVMLKAVEHRLQHKIDVNDKNNKLRIKAHNDMYTSSLKELPNVATERHVLFVHDVKKV